MRDKTNEVARETTLKIPIFKKEGRDAPDGRADVSLHRSEDCPPTVHEGACWSEYLSCNINPCWSRWTFP